MVSNSMQRTAHSHGVDVLRKTHVAGTETATCASDYMSIPERLHEVHLSAHPTQEL